MYPTDQICIMIDILADNIFVKFAGVYFVKLLESYGNELCSIARRPVSLLI